MPTDMWFWVSVFSYVAGIVHHTIATRRIDHADAQVRFAMRCTLAFLDWTRARNKVLTLAACGAREQALIVATEAEARYTAAINEAFEQDA